MKYTRCIKYMILCLSALILFSCSDGKNYSVEEIDGIKHFYNKNKANNKDLRIEYTKIKSLDLEEIFKLPVGHISSPSFSLNTEGTVIARFCYYDKGDFILANLNCHNNTFKRFRFNRGEGPQEMNYVTFMYETDSLINCGNRNKILSFNKVLKYVSEVRNNENYDIVKTIKEVYGVFNNQLLAYSFSFDGPRNNIEVGIKIGLYDKETFKEVINLAGFKFYVDDINKIYNYKDKRIDAASSNKEIFISEQFPDKYKIHVFDLSGNKKYVTNKSFRKIKYHEDEVEFINTSYDIKQSRMGRKNTKKFKRQYKKIINSISSDENGYLFAQISEDYNKLKKGKLLYDIFKEGVFLDRVELELNYCDTERVFYKNNLYFAGDKMINVGYNKDSNILLDIYDYKIHTEK